MVRRLLTVVLIALLLVVVLAAGELVTGRVSYVITNGHSMIPLYHQGDLVVVTKSSSYQVGQIVAYRVPAKHTVILHRIIGRYGAGFIMKGDNNQSIDPTHPSVADVVGRATVLVPDGGLWLERLTSPVVVLLIVSALLVGSGTIVSTKRKRKKGTMSQHSTIGVGHHMVTSLSTSPPWLRTAAALTSVIAIAGLAIAAVSWSVPTTNRAVSQVPVGLSMSYSYSASVPLTPAYGGTTVSSPSPVFRKLANIVDVQFAYQGTPGSVIAAAYLSTSSGWKSIVPLSPRTSFRTSHYEGTVQLDLASLDARAQAAAAVIGLPTEPLTVDVVARVSTAADALFAPPLLFSLTPLQLTLVGGPTSLVTHDIRTVREVTTVHRTFGVLGRRITVSTARDLSSILLLAGLLGATVLVLIGRRFTSTSEGAGIRRRYAPLLVAIHPLPISSGSQVIDVTEFGTLARLAELYGLLVLTWSYNTCETFIVQNQGVIYRYRAAVDHVGDPGMPINSDFTLLPAASPPQPIPDLGSLGADTGS